jgi:FkbM family methyltransferase
MISRKIRGVIQGGASIGEEIPDWDRLGVKNRVFIEPIPDLFPILEANAKKNLTAKTWCFNVALSDFDGDAEFHISTGSFCSSSLMDFTPEAKKYGDELVTERLVTVSVRQLDTLVEKNNIPIENFNCLYLDVQGNEYKALLGAKKTLEKMDFLFVEVNHIELYQGSILWEQFHEFVKNLGWKLSTIRNHESEKNNHFVTYQSEALFFNKHITTEYFKS